MEIMTTFILLGSPNSSGGVCKLQWLWELHQLQQPAVRLVYCGEHVFSEVPVPECSGASEMGAELQPVHLNHNHPQPVCPGWPWDSELYKLCVSLCLIYAHYPTAECDSLPRIAPTPDKRELPVLVCRQRETEGDHSWCWGGNSQHCIPVQHHWEDPYLHWCTAR